jgi:type 2 lantibiotic biosynthesis protein LanM
MTDEIFHGASWYRALTIEERASSLRSARSKSDRAENEPEPEQRELGRRELELLRSQSPLDRDEWFARYLAVRGVTEDELVEILGEPIENVAARSARPPDWLLEIERAYENDPRPIASLSPSLTIDATEARMLELVEPLVRRGLDRLHARIVVLARRKQGVPLAAARTPDLLLGPLLARLQTLIERVFVLELNVARMQGELEGTTPEERFDAFTQRLRTRDRALALLAEYPVLARRAVETIERWERTSFELCEHLCADWTNVWATFSPDRDPGRIVSIRGGMGDTHRGGRSVVVVKFESGLRLVYKPRSLAIDAHFQELLAWCNAALEDHYRAVLSKIEAERDPTSGDISLLDLVASEPLPDFRALRVLERRDHGWVEFVEAHPCASRDEVRNFYRRQGSSLALLHALEAVDLHFENVIAAGERPVFIDLETLFHPRPPLRDLADADLCLVRDASSASVMRTGLLPSRAWSDDGASGGVDVSGLGGTDGALSPDALLHWRGAGTDEMHAARERTPLPEGKHAPALAGEDVSATDHVDDIVRGFEGMSRILIRRRDELAPHHRAAKHVVGGPLERFADDEVRVVLRPTRAYGLLLFESTHPDFLRDALELERFLDKLWVGIDEAPHLLEVIGAEQLDLLQGDIPFFSTRVGSRDLLDSRGDRRESFFAMSGLETVSERLREANEADVERQSWFIRGAFATAAVDPSDLRWPKYESIDAPRELDLDDEGDAMRPSAAVREELIARARSIGDRLESLALRDEQGNAAWIGFKFEAGRWDLVALPDDLYSGVLGVAHFLAHLGAITGEHRYTDLARAALVPLRKRIREGRLKLGPIGAFNGLGGIVYAFAHASRMWNDAQLLDEARAVAELAAQRIDVDEDLDVIGGAAGFIQALASLHALSPTDRWLELARRCGDRLVDRAASMERGVGWLTRIEHRQPATGYSHGASGIAAALARLTALTGDARYRDCALRAIEYEDTQFDEATRNWLDPGGQAKQSRAQDGTLMVAWCYGAPGIGLARLALAEDGVSAREVGGDAQRGAKTATGTSGAPKDHTLSQITRGDGIQGDRVLGDRIRRDLDVAIATTREIGFGRNHSLCHGDLGNLEFLMLAAARTRDTELAHFVHEKIAAVLAGIARDGPLCGMPLGVESVALMNGLAGIGFGLLRLAEPERVPSVLTLAPPADVHDRSARS